MIDINYINKNLIIGKTIEVDGTHIKAELDSNINELSRVYNSEVYSIGQYGSIIKSYFGNKILYMYVTRLRMKSEIEAEKGVIISPENDSRILEADLFGEGSWNQRVGTLSFERGISVYPLPLQEIFLTTEAELRAIYSSNTSSSVKIGDYVGTSNIPCYVDIDEFFSKHTAVLGSTGSGKSATVSAIIHAVLSYKDSINVEDNQEVFWHPHIVILDPHNEYSTAFPTATRLVSDEGTLKLPYWLMNYQELVDLFIGKTEFQATSQTNILKMALLEAKKNGCELINIEEDSITIDSPVPFSLDKLVELIKADMPSQASKQDKHWGIVNKIEVLKNDSRLNFLMQNWSDGLDEIVDIVKQFISIDNSLKIIDLSGIPNDVAGIVSSTISRLLFMYKLWETEIQRKEDPILLICEEAHRYVPNTGEAEYAAAQQAIKRIAKEGRKYGLGLMLISQRPSEIESTVLSQCNSWIVMRLTNSIDQTYVVKFLPDSLNNMGNILSSLRRREALVIGQGVSLPSRILVNLLNKNQLPKSNDISFIDGWKSGVNNPSKIIEVIQRWRSQMREVGEGASEMNDSGDVFE